jgi:hypothetical protein
MAIRSWKDFDWGQICIRKLHRAGVGGAAATAPPALTVPRLSILRPIGRPSRLGGVRQTRWRVLAVLNTVDGARAMQELLEDESTFINFGQSLVFITGEHPIF